MKKAKPTKQAGNRAKNESNKGDNKGRNIPKEKKDNKPLKQTEKGYPVAKSFAQVKPSKSELLAKAREYILKAKQEVQALNKKFPEPVLKRVGSEKYTLDIDLNQEALKMMTSLASEFAARLQETEASRLKGTIESAKIRKEASTNWKESFLKFRADYLQTNKRLDFNIPDSKIIKAFKKDNPDSPSQSTLYSYIK